MTDENHLGPYLHVLNAAVDVLSDPDFLAGEVPGLNEFCEAEPEPYRTPTLAELGFDRTTGTLRGRRLA
ncbi:hypothetical protein [Saccharothrix sp. HUAS TT1]|uniref:hypothetical protein n=1 Tax=unclassified Saccharothrix TaxID=2593673 RepID=UPI00345C470A